MLVDANLLIYARNDGDPRHGAARDWLTSALRGTQRVGLPWASLGAFLRIATLPRIYSRPLTTAEACAEVEAWLAAPASWIPSPGPGYATILGELMTKHRVTANLVPDAMLAALAFEHGLTVCSTDTDFARFREVRWLDPLASA